MSSKEYHREWYEKNKEKRHEQSRQAALRRKHKLVVHMGGKCSRCSGVFPDCAYDLHHTDPSKKEFSISSQRLGYQKMLEEAEKCVLLCANCHRITHMELLENTK